MRKFNPKRRIQPAPSTDEQRNTLSQMANKAIYTGNPAHKRNRGDFGLTPPAGARGDKNLCDGANVFSRKEAQMLLQAGIRRGLVSERVVDGWPQNVWAISNNNVALEAMRESEGKYHGYSLPIEDPLAQEIRKRWNAD